MSRLLAAAPLLLLTSLLPACADGPAETTGSDTSSDDSSGGDPTGGSAAAVTYYRDIKPILDSKCSNCHRPGNIAPFSLTSHEEAAMWAPALAAAVMAGTMPPWPPEAGCNSYEHDRSLPEEQQLLISEWAELGAPAGDPADAPAPPAPPPEIDYDLQLSLPVPYTPTVAPDEYRCFLIDWPADEVKYVTGFKVTPGQPAIVHHVIAFLVPPAQVAEYDALDAADPDPGYLCYGGPGGPRPQWLGAWVPGSDTGALPEGTGVRVEPGTRIAVQMHYHTLPGVGPDQSTLAIRTADSVERRAHVLPFTNPAWVTGQTPMLIPAGAPAVTHSFAADLSKSIAIIAPDGELASGDPLIVHAASTHMHTLGVASKISVERADGGSECALSIPRWDFDWQGQYQLREPLRLELGDKLRIDCTWNNAAGAKDVLWGEGTGDEMCLGVVYVTGV